MDSKTQKHSKKSAHLQRLPHDGVSGRPTLILSPIFQKIRTQHAESVVQMFEQNIQIDQIYSPGQYQKPTISFTMDESVL